MQLIDLVLFEALMVHHEFYFLLLDLGKCLSAFHDHLGKWISNKDLASERFETPRVLEFQERWRDLESS